MTTEYGLFNDEGCVERQLWSYEEAALRAQEYDPEDDLTVSALCPEHEEHAAIDCELCAEELCDECMEVLGACGCDRCETCGLTLDGQCECPETAAA